MAINIKDADTDRLARELAELTGETVYRVRTLDLHNLNRHVERAQSLEVQQSKAIRTKVQRSAAPAVLGFEV